MILLNKFIQCLDDPWTLNNVRLNLCYVSGCLANSIILQRKEENIIFCRFNAIILRHAQQNIEFNCFDSFYYGSYDRVNLCYSVSRLLIFRDNNHVNRLKLYVSHPEKIMAYINTRFYLINTDSDIKAILRSIYV